MKKHIMNFLKRGLVGAGGGPLILAIIYICLGASGVVESLTPNEVCLGILTALLMAFVAAGISVVYDIEKLPLLAATLIHAAVLYADYLLIYLVNGWIPGGGLGIAIFTAIYIAYYGLIWTIIYLTIKAKTEALNRKLREETA